MYIGVIGQRTCTEEAFFTAKEVGRLIAESGSVLVCGGMGGIMEAAAKGAFDAGGLTIGILPGFLREEANPYIKIAIPTGLGLARNMLVVRASDVLIAITGGYGTLSEIAFALASDKTVIGLGTWDLVKDGKTSRDIRKASTPEDAVQKALKAPEI